MDYCLGSGDDGASIWSAAFDVDVDHDGVFDAVRLDLDGDGERDDALADLDDDGMADHAVLDFESGSQWFTDDGTGTWGVPADRGAPLRWFSLDGVRGTGGPELDFDGDGVADQLVDVDADGLADRVLCGNGSGGFGVGYVDIDGDGDWDVRLVDADGDGAAEAAAQL
jgi:hypothetical protein